MNPVVALGLIAAVALLTTRLPGLPVRHPLSLDLVLAAGGPLVLLGLVLGPGLNVLDRAVLRALAPVTALGVGWIGAVFGARFEWRYVKRIPPRIWLLGLLEAAAVFVLVAFSASLLGLLFPSLRAAWAPRLPTILTLAAVATVSGPSAVELVARTVGIRRSVAQAFALAAALETAFGALAMTLALAIYHPRQPAGGVALGWFSWLALAVGSGALVGMLFLSVTRLRPAREDLAVALLGALLFGAGVGYAADLSPFVVCALAAVAIGNVAPERRHVRALLAAWEHPIYAVFLMVTGALLAMPTLWLLVAAPLLGAVRVGVKWASVRLARVPLRLEALPPNVGLATVAQGGVAVALGINYVITYGGAPAGAGEATLTTIILGVAGTQLVAPPLMGLAVRPAPVEAAAPTPELTADSSGA